MLRLSIADSRLAVPKQNIVYRQIVAVAFPVIIERTSLV